jgi:hypothetical protein
VPKILLGHQSGIIVTNASEADGTNDYADWGRKNFYHIYDTSLTTGNGMQVNISNSIPVIDAMSFDNKVDDGLPKTGNVRAGGPGDVSAGANNTTSGCVNNPRTAYRANSTGRYPCSLLILLQSQAGQD